MISVENVTKNFGAIRAVNGVSFQIETGEVVGFLGPNGAGKSTTMRMITGFLPPTSGRVDIGGTDMAKDPVAAKAKIGYLPESAALYTDMEVTDFLFFMGRMRGMTSAKLAERLKAVVRQCQLEGVLGRKIATLSKGYRQRVGLAQALLHDPDILILDEPTVGLDPNQIFEIRELIRDIGRHKTILLSTHILQEVSATCQRVIIINGGRIVAQGTPDSLTSGDLSQASYRTAIRGSAERIQEELLKLPGALNVALNRSEGDLHHFTIAASGAEDLSEMIFQMVVRNNGSLALLTREKQSLEDVFKQLTKHAA